MGRSEARAVKLRRLKQLWLVIREVADCGSWAKVTHFGGRSAEEIESLLSTHDLIACSHAAHSKYGFLWSSRMMLDSRLAASY